MSKPLGYILYNGPSALDGSPIIVVANKVDTASKNSKTGAMVQTWILRSDVDPSAADKSGDDVSICGDCPHRRNTATDKRSCYVTLFRAPRSVYAAYHRGRYVDVSGTDYSEIFRGKVVRLGAYGDPAACPASVWEKYTRHATSWTGYTHQWRDATALQPYCMASVDSSEQAAEASLRGWRYFRVGPVDDRAHTGEVLCPASEEGGRRTTCESCTLCKGTTSKSSRSIMIPAHGPGKRYVTLI